jgi:FkbM family methyltransferase
MSLFTKIAGLKSILKFDNRWELVFNRLFFRKCLNVYRYKGMEILVDHEGGDACGTRLCLTTNMYKQFLGYMSLPQNIVVCDIGANGGGFSLMLKAAGNSIEKLVCIEMNPNTWSRLIFNINRNFSCKRECLNLAIGGRDQELEIYLGKGSTSDSIFSRKNKSRESKKYRISSKTFDRIYEGYFGDEEIIDICKIDIEGAEYELFFNPGHDAIKHCRYLLIEIHHNNEKSKDEIIHEIQKSGFTSVPTAAHQSEEVYLFENNKL